MRVRPTDLTEDMLGNIVRSIFEAVFIYFQDALYGTNSDVYRDMKKLASIEFTGVAFPMR